MKTSQDRILTTHVGSLPNPAAAALANAALTTAQRADIGLLRYDSRMTRMRR
jgi:hypothetical protein